MELEFIHGKMVENTKESIKTIKSTDLGFILGLTLDSIQDGGAKENSMDLGHIMCQKQI